MEKKSGIFCLRPETISEYLSIKSQMELVEDIGAYLKTKEPNNCYWCVREQDIEILKTPKELEGCKRFKTVVAANHKGDKMDIGLCFLFCPDDISNKDAIALAQSTQPFMQRLS